MLCTTNLIVLIHISLEKVDSNIVGNLHVTILTSVDHVINLTQQIGFGRIK